MSRSDLWLARRLGLIDWAVRRLIVNADDFGLTTGINRAVVELHRCGLLTSTTLMARAGATDDAIAQALAAPSLGVGCHVVLVDGEPLLAAREIPTLADRRTGVLHRGLGSFMQQVVLGHIQPDEIEAEAAAQIALLQRRGLSLTHIDTHKHTHMFPKVLRPLLRAARAAGISTVRNPFEPAWSRGATSAAPLLRRTQVSLLHHLEPGFRQIVAEEGFITTDGTVGVLATGTLNAATINSLLQNMPAGTWELVTHPGYNDADLARIHTRLKGSRETEYEAIRSIGRGDGFKLISFAQVAANSANIGLNSTAR
jgi:hopanoid biosynthesis associated protein HpnK